MQPVILIIMKGKIQDQPLLEAIQNRCGQPGRLIESHPNIDEAIQSWEKGPTPKESEPVFLVVDNNCPGPIGWTWGEEQVKQLREKDTVEVAMSSPCLLIGSSTVLDRIARKWECWAFRYVCHTMERETFLRVDDPLADFHRWPIAPWKAFGTSHACMARIHEYLSWIKDIDPDFAQVCLALSRNIAHNVSLDTPFPLSELKHLTRTGLKRHEIHDFKAISGVGPLCLLEGMYRLGEIDVESYKKGVCDILKTIGYPLVVIEDILPKMPTVPIECNEIVRSARETLQDKTILVIDDHPELWEVALRLSFSGATVSVMTEPFDLKNVNREIDKSDLVLLDLYFDNIPNEQQAWIEERYGNKAWGLYLLDCAFNQKPVVPVFMFTTSERADRASSSLRFGVTEFLTKETLTDDPDPVSFAVSFFRTIRSALLWGDVLIPSFEAIEVLKGLQLDVFPLYSVLLGIQDAATPLGRRLGLTPLSQAAVAIKTFYEENRAIPQSTDPIVFGFLCNNLRNASAHGRARLMCKLDILIAWCSFLAGFQLAKRILQGQGRSKESINRLKQQARDISQAFWCLIHKEGMAVTNMDENRWVLPDKPSKTEVEKVCREIWRKICENARKNQRCAEKEGKGFIPVTIIDKDGKPTQSNFQDPCPNYHCIYRDNAKQPRFVRSHLREGRSVPERVFCIYHSFHPSAFMLFDIIQCVLIRPGLSMANAFYELMGLRAENLYVLNFEADCGCLDHYRYHKPDGVAKTRETSKKDKMAFHFFMIDDQMRNINQMSAFLIRNGMDQSRFAFLDPNQLQNVIQCPEAILNHLPKWVLNQVRPIFIIDLVLHNDASEGYALVSALWNEFQNNASYIINSVLCNADSAVHIPSGCRFYCFDQARQQPEGILDSFAVGNYPTLTPYAGTFQKSEKG